MGLIICVQKRGGSVFVAVFPSVGVLVLVLVLEYNSSTCKYSARTRLSVLKIYLDLARTRFFVLEFFVYSNVKYSVLGLSTREYNSSTALNRFPQMGSPHVQTYNMYRPDTQLFRPDTQKTGRYPFFHPR